MIIFIGIVLLVAFGMNGYVLWRLAGFFHLKRGLVFWSIVILCSISYILASILQSRSGGILSRIVYTLAADWVGILWLFFVTLLVYEIVQLFIKINPFTAGIVIVSLVLLLSIAAMINAQRLRIRKIQITGNADLRLVQLSDIHLGSISNCFFQRIIDKTKALDPDAVLITGDLVDNLNANTQKAIAQLKQINAPIFFVGGNHETYVGFERVARKLAEADVRVLRNERVDFNDIQIVGINDHTPEDKIEWVLQHVGIEPSRFCILMYHRPVDLAAFAHPNVDLILSGHTHNGQIFPFNLIVGRFFRHVRGLHQNRDTTLYVSCGTGTWGPRMRLGSVSEIALVEIRRPQ